MPLLLHCGFLANQPQPEGSEPNNCHELASATPVPATAPLALAKPAAGGWGFALAASGEDRVFAWGVNAATVLSKAGGNEDGVDPAVLEVRPQVPALVSRGLATRRQTALVRAGGPALSHASLPLFLTLSTVMLSPLLLIPAFLPAGGGHRRSHCRPGRRL